MLVIRECVGSLTEIAFKTSDSQVHLTHLPCRSVILLTIYRYVPYVLLMALHKLCRLYEHTSRTTGRVVYSSAIWLQDFNNRTHNARRGIELTGVLSLLRCKLPQTVFIHTSEHIQFVVVGTHLHVRENLNHVSKPVLIKFTAVIILRQNILQRWVCLLYESHGIINNLTDYRILGIL